MKFTVNREAFMEFIKPAMELTGRKIGKYNIEKYSRIDQECLDAFLDCTKKAIDSSISELIQNEKYAILKRGIYTIKRHVCTYITNDFEKLRRITFEAHQDSIQVLASNGDIVLSTEISGEDLALINYECEEEGILTVESARLWVFFQSIENCDRIIISSEGDCLAKIESVQDKEAVRRFAKLHYHAKPTFIYKPILVGTMPSRMLTDGLRNVIFACNNKRASNLPRYIIVSISPNHLRFIGGNGVLFSFCDIHSGHIENDKKICFALSPGKSESLIKTLQAFKGGDIEIYRKTRSKNNPWDILIKQNNTILSLGVRNGDKLKSSIESAINCDFKYRASTRAEEWISILNSIKPSCITSNPLIDIKADFVEGCFDVEYNSKGAKIVSCIPFSYESELSYIDPKSVKRGDASISSNVASLATIFKNTKPNDILTFDFGIKKANSRKKKFKCASNWCLVSYPSKAKKTKDSEKELFALFQVSTRKDNLND